METDDSAGSMQSLALDTTLPDIDSPSSHPCVACKRHKVKCNRQIPCSNCSRKGVECVMAVPLKLPRGRQGGRKKKKAEQNRLLERIARLEGLMTDGETQGTLFATSTIPSTTSFPALILPTPPDVALPSLNRRPVHYLDQFLGTSFWATLTDEIGGLKDVLLDVSEDEENEYETIPEILRTPAQEIDSGRSQLIFPITMSEETLACPSRTEIYILCDIYLTNVNPMLRILHGLSLRKYLQGGSRDLDCSPGYNGLEALKFAIYFGAIVTLDNHECEVRFNSDKMTLLAIYRNATEKALSKANLVNTTEMSTLQALTIYLTSVRAIDNSRFTWTLLSLAVRIAQAMGLHLEATAVSFQPFEREMRRRLWWQICVLDAQAAEDRASSPVLIAESFNTKLPLRINDDDLHFGTSQEVTERDGYNDMTFCLICYEVFHTVHRLNFVSARPFSQIPPQSPHSKWRSRVDMVVQTQKHIEERYVRFLDLLSPFQWTTRMVADVITATMWLLIYRPLQNDPNSSLSPYGNVDILRLAIDVMERAQQLSSDALAKPFRWLSRTHVQWHAIAITAAELCVQTEGPVVERAWAILNLTYHEIAKDVADSEQGMLWAPIKKLMVRARRIRHQYIHSLSPLHAPQDVISPGELFQRVNERSSIRREEHQEEDLTSSLAPFDWDSWLASETPGELQQPSELNMTGWVNWEKFMNDFQDQGDFGGCVTDHGLS